jgi:hypothetical protein
MRFYARMDVSKKVPLLLWLNATFYEVIDLVHLEEITAFRSCSSLPGWIFPGKFLWSFGLMINHSRIFNVFLKKLVYK